MDNKILRRLFVQVGMVTIPGAGAFPLVLPRQTWRRGDDIDADACRAGLKAYVRPETPGEWPEGMGETGTHVLVREADGVRVRRPVRIGDGNKDGPNEGMP